MKTLLATSILMTTVIGAGIFALPYAGAKSGFLIVSVILLLLTLVMVFVHLFYGEIVSNTKEKYQLPGYVGHYLGKRAKALIGFIGIIGFYGSLLVYIIVGGNFLHILLSTAMGFQSVIIFDLIFFALATIVIYFGIKLVSGVDLVLGVFLILIILFFFIFGYKNINLENFKYIELKNLFIPYGVALYSLIGVAAIPTVVWYLNNKSYKKAIVIGTLVPALIYLVFLFVVIGITGKNTSLDAISGLLGIMGSKIIFWWAILGFLTTFTSYIGLGLALKDMYVYDFKINRKVAIFLVSMVPLILLSINKSNFVTIIQIMGALLGAFEGTAIVIMHRRILGRRIWDYAIILTFIAGFIYTMASIIMKH